MSGTAPDEITRTAESPAGREDGRLVSPLTGLVALLLVACFAPYLRWMWEIWMRSGYYGHGPLIPLISAYIVYSRRRDFAAAKGGQNLWGLPIAGVGLAIYAAAVYWNVHFPQGFAMVMVIGGLTLLLWGWGRAKVLAFPILFLAFMVPTGRLLVTQFSNPLQVHAAGIAAATASFFGLPVKLHGTTIMIPDYTFEVAEPCSGLKSAIAMTALAALLAYLVQAPMWKRVLLFAAGIPIALLANSVRITFTLFLGRAFGEGAAEGFFHTGSGLMVFLLGLLGLFGVAKVLKCNRMRSDIW
ncbi:MAG: exosortase/archaeosortase family protein [Armatimonadota bacterium]